MKLEFESARKLQSETRRFEKSPFIPLFQRGISIILDPLQVKKLSSLLKKGSREGFPGRIFKPPDCYVEFIYCGERKYAHP
jgi:hypothetical protein